jgi:hypothetical protein
MTIARAAYPTTPDVLTLHGFDPGSGPSTPMESGAGVDQRGYPRPKPGATRCAIGSVEP